MAGNGLDLQPLPRNRKIRSMKTYPMVSFRCDNQFRRALEREAKRRDMSVSELIKEAVTKHLHNKNPQ
jgi:predicted DNA-binding ribbon-helix-helix protein